MQLPRVAAALLLLPVASCSAVGHARETITPVQQVVSLLNDMLVKGKEEKHAEEVQYAAYKQFCDGTTAQKEAAIEQAAMDIEHLQADIQKAVATGGQLDSEVSQHMADVTTWEGDKKAASEVRGMEASDYSAMHQDYSESIDALERAIQSLKAQDYARPQSEAAFVQSKQDGRAALPVQLAALQKLRLIPAAAKRSLDLFFAQGVQAQAPAAPEAHGYEFQSGKIIDLLKELLDEFRDERADLEKHELNSKHAYELLMEELTAEIGQATKDANAKKNAHASIARTKAEKEGSLAETSDVKASDEAYLSDLKASCESKAADFADREQLRSEELKSIEDAIAILSSDAVSGNAAKHLPTMLQALNRSKGPVLASIRGFHASGGDNERKAHDFLIEQAHKLNSQALASLAAKLKDTDPFADVKKLIQDLIVRLMEEANEEADHKGWCDAELASNERARQDKSDDVDALHAKIDELNAEVAMLSSDLSDLSQDVADLTAAMAEATNARTKEKSANEGTIKDSRDAQEAISRAMVVLREFYAGAADATSLVQKQQPEAPEIFDTAYKGMQAESSGVMGLLEVIASDFARLEADTTAAETAAASEYKKLMSDSDLNKVAKNKDIEHKTLQKQNKEQALAATRSDLEGTQQELNAALAYYEKLKPSCVDAGVSYDERVKMREEEIQSLQEALKILGDETVL